MVNWWRMVVYYPRKPVWSGPVEDVRLLNIINFSNKITNASPMICFLSISWSDKTFSNRLIFYHRFVGLKEPSATAGLGEFGIQNLSSSTPLKQNPRNHSSTRSLNLGILIWFIYNRCKWYYILYGMYYIFFSRQDVLLGKEMQPFTTIHWFILLRPVPQDVKVDFCSKPIDWNELSDLQKSHDASVTPFGGLSWVSRVGFVLRSRRTRHSTGNDIPKCVLWCFFCDNLATWQQMISLKNSTVWWKEMAQRHSQVGWRFFFWPR